MKSYRMDEVMSPSSCKGTYTVDSQLRAAPGGAQGDVLGRRLEGMRLGTTAHMYSQIPVLGLISECIATRSEMLTLDETRTAHHSADFCPFESGQRHSGTNTATLNTQSRRFGVI